MSYVELTVTIAPKEQGSEVLIAELSELGFESFVDAEQGFVAYISNSMFDKNAVELLLT
jgi:ribosomal protein L11 methyltransferase